MVTTEQQHQQHQQEGRCKLAPWHTLVFAVWAALTCGFLYTFSTFSQALGKALSLSPADRSTVGTCQVVVGFGTWMAGLLVDKVGVSVVLVGGAIVNGGAWFLMAGIAVWGWSVPDPLLAVAVLIATSTFAAASVTAAVFKVLTQNFQSQRAAVIGIAKAWVGQSAGLLTTVFTGLHPSKEADPERLNFLWYLSGTCFFLPLLAAPFLRLLDKSIVEASEAKQDCIWISYDRRIPVLTGLTLAMIAVAATAAFLDQNLSQEARLTLTWVLIALAASPAILLLPRTRNRPMSSSADRDEGGAVGSQGDDQAVVMAAQMPPSPWECGPAKMIRRPAGIALWFIIFSLQSGGILLTTNFGLIAESRSGTKVDTHVLVTLFSCSQALARLSGGSWSDLTIKRHIPRTWCFVGITLIMALAQAMMCMPGPVPLCIGVILAGLAFGLHYPIMIVVIAELFGVNKIASNYMVYDGTPSASASLFVAKLLAGLVYDAHTPHGQDKCMGDQCYRITHMTLVVFELLACITSIWLSRASRVVYRESVWAAPRQQVNTTDKDGSCDELIHEAAAQEVALRRRPGDDVAASA